MEYNEILRLSNHFQPVYDLENEIGNYWKQFIPNQKFCKVLSSLLNSLDTNKPEERRPIWLQGTYGTGKSHATAVIKHLLFDDIEKINDFEIENTQLKFRLNSFRTKNKVFPVVLKGTSNIHDNRSFALVIEKAVKESLRNEGIELKTKTDFDEVISKLQSNDLNWKNLFQGTELEAFGSKEDIISKLQREDPDILTKIEDILSEKGIHFDKENISKWLEEVQKELKDDGIADYLMIYWDEFTGIFELPKSGIILTELQNIVELAIKGIYLFIVSHRKPYQTDMSQDDVEKILGRFKVSDYSMEPVTTYHIINATINKIDKARWNEIKDKHINSIKPLIKEITNNEGINTQKSLENLFPIHPYTAYLATFIARHIGSTERSIFKFLYDDKKGFKRFIKNNPSKEGKIFLSADYLWDFFYDDFERVGNEKIISVLERFKLYKNTLENEGNDYLIVFKGILLLNILYRVMEVTRSSLVTPSENNLKNLFAGCLSERNLSSILKFIDDNQIITKTPDNLYILTSSGLPQSEIENEKNKLKKKFSKIDGILSNDKKFNITNSIKESVIREIEILVLGTHLKEHLIKGKLEKAFANNYSIHSCLFLGKDKQELQMIKNIVKKISSEPYFEDIIFIVSDVILDTKQFELFLSYNARSIVAEKHNYTDERITNEQYADKIIFKWADQIKSGYIQWFFKGKTGNELMGQLSNKINNNFSKEIFSLGLENIEGAKRNKNIWKSEKSKKSIETFLFTNNREEIEIQTSKGADKTLKEIIKDNKGEFIVNLNLEFKAGVSEDHPLKAMDRKIAEKLEKGKCNGTFNLGTDLKVLTEPPYGLYQNKVNIGAFSFLMRQYNGKLYAAGTGVPIQKEKMRDKILDLFDYWQTGKGREKLDVRFGSEDEEKLIDTLNGIFGFEDIKSLNDTRWKIREWVKKIGFPISIFKHSDSINTNTKKALESIFKIIKSIDKELTTEKISEYLDSIELAKYDLNYILPKKNHRELFEKWLKSIETIDITSEDYEDVIVYLQKNMQEEIASWTEDKTREEVKDWFIAKSASERKKKFAEEESVKGESVEEESVEEESVEEESVKGESVKGESVKGESVEEESVKGESVKGESVKGESAEGESAKEVESRGYTENKYKKDIKTQIELCEEKKLRKVIINVIDERPDLIGIIEKYLEV